MASRSKTTTDRKEIQSWAEERGGKPVIVRGTENDGEGAGLLRIDFPGYSGGDRFEEISWDEFFETMEKKDLALVIQDTTSDGEQSNFNRFVSRTEEGEEGRKAG